MLPNSSVESFDFKNSWISMKQSFSSAFSNWSSMKLNTSISPNFDSISFQYAQILVFKNAFSIFGFFSLCRQDLMATSSILRQNQWELVESIAMLSAKVFRLCTYLKVHSVGCWSNNTASICRLLLLRVSIVMLNLFQPRGMLAWQSIINNFLRQLKQASSWGLLWMMRS